jgi:hypothetical protein
MFGHQREQAQHTPDFLLEFLKIWLATSASAPIESSYPEGGYSADFDRQFPKKYGNLRYCSLEIIELLVKFRYITHKKKQINNISTSTSDSNFLI